MVNADVWSPFWNNSSCAVETMTWQLLLAIAIQFHPRKIALRSPFLHLTMELEIKLPTKCQLRPPFPMCQANIPKIITKQVLCTDLLLSLLICLPSFKIPTLSKILICLFWLVGNVLTYKVLRRTSHHQFFVQREHGLMWCKVSAHTDCHRLLRGFCIKLHVSLLSHGSWYRLLFLPQYVLFLKSMCCCW